MILVDPETALTVSNAVADGVSSMLSLLQMELLHKVADEVCKTVVHVTEIAMVHRLLEHYDRVRDRR